MVIYKPDFIPYYIGEAEKHGLTMQEGLAFGFIKFYGKNQEFYFSSEDFADIIGTTAGTVDNIVYKLKKKGIIETKIKRYNNNGKISTIRKIKLLDPISPHSESMSSPHSENTISLCGENTISPHSEIKENIKRIKRERENTLTVSCETSHTLFKNFDKIREFVHKYGLYEDCLYNFRTYDEKKIIAKSNLFDPVLEKSIANLFKKEKIKKAIQIIVDEQKQKSKNQEIQEKPAEIKPVDKEKAKAFLRNAKNLINKI